MTLTVAIATTIFDVMVCFCKSFVVAMLGGVNCCYTHELHETVCYGKVVLRKGALVCKYCLTQARRLYTNVARSTLLNQEVWKSLGLGHFCIPSSILFKHLQIISLMGETEPSLRKAILPARNCLPEIARNLPAMLLQKASLGAVPYEHKVCAVNRDVQKQCVKKTAKRAGRRAKKHTTKSSQISTQFSEQFIV